MRGQMWSPGRPSTARRVDRVRFWEAIAGGLSSEDAAVQAGVSPAVGSRWFRQGGGMPPISLAPVSGRYLSFSEREAIAILGAQQLGVRAIARRIGRSPSTISRELRRDEARPYVVVDFEPDRPPFMNLVVANLGRTMARNVRIETDPPLESTCTAQGRWRWPS